MCKDKILQNIRVHKTKTAPLLKPFSIPEEKSGKLNRFKEILQQAGGKCFEVNGAEKLTPFLRERFPGATNFRIKEVWEEYPPDNPKEKLTQLKTVILEGQFGVAENGAVWMDESNFPNRLLPFITEELVVCLGSKQITANMHEAYSRIGNHTTGFGVFISGPSKTADIEQNLVFGAHGAKTYAIILY
jgi:L-lactate dehydrogenase complex protein LldG